MPSDNNQTSSGADGTADPVTIAKRWYDALCSGLASVPHPKQGRRKRNHM
jgi:hypothetical protein